MSLRYRPEIDGLRTIAILSVILYHMKIPITGGYLLEGGFLGVDIFFVISGYLIGGILLEEISQTGRINFREFYLRRARRILPELLVVTLITASVSWLTLLPSEITRYSRSIYSAVGFYSNIFWYYELGEYGAQSGLLQPLLHTWSLSIEEQFYLLFPVGLIFAHRILKTRRLGLLIGTGIVLSLIIAQGSTYIKPPLSFFSPLSRAWELLAGVGLARLASTHPSLFKNNRLSYLTPPLMLLVLAICITSINLDSGTHPGIGTVPVIAATCSLIWFMRPGELITNKLSSGPMVYIGKLSYSLYLWHFPIFAFGRLQSFENPTMPIMLAWLAATGALSWVSYRLVGQPLRKDAPISSFMWLTTTALAATAAYSGVVINNNGFPGRFDQVAQRFGENQIDLEILRDESLGIIAKLTPNERVGPWIAGSRSKHEKEDNWFTANARKKVLVIGNSHSKDMFNALYSNSSSFDGIEFARLAFDADMSPSMMEEMFEIPNFKSADTILVTPKYRSTSILMLDKYIPRIIQSGKRVVLVGNTAEFVSPSVLPIFDWYLWHGDGGINTAEINKLGYKYESNEAKVYSRKVQDLAIKYGLPYYDRRGIMCSDSDQSCTLVTPAGKRTMYDDSHWTLDGAHYFGSIMAQRGWLQ